MNNVPCRYFQSATGCRFGSNCRYSHSGTSSSSTTSSTVQRSKREAPTCIFYASPGGCRYGQSCYYKHDKSTLPKKEEEEENSSLNIAKPDEKDLLIVSGYIRELCTTLSSSHAREKLSDLISLCQSYYSIIIKWEEYNVNNMSIINNATCIKKNRNNNWGSAFLSEEYSNGIHHWKFKIESLDSRRKYYVLFGLWKTNSGSYIFDSFFTDKKNNGYAMNVIDGTLTIPNTPGCGGIKYATYCKKGDIIDMYCDFNNLLLTYAINGKYYANGQKIENTKYKVAVTMYWEGDMIRFLSHDNKLFTK